MGYWPLLPRDSPHAQAQAQAQYTSRRSGKGTVWCIEEKVLKVSDTTRNGVVMTRRPDEGGCEFGASLSRPRRGAQYK